MTWSSGARAIGVGCGVYLAVNLGLLIYVVLDAIW